MVRMLAGTARQLQFLQHGFGVADHFLECLVAAFGLDDLHHRLKIGDRLTRDGHDAITDLQAHLLRRAPRHDLADLGRDGRVPEIEAESRHQRAGLGECPTVAFDHELRLARACGALSSLQFEFDRGVVHQAIENREHGAFARGDRLAGHADDGVALLQPGAGRDRIGSHVPDDWLQRRRADDQQDPVGDRGKQEIGERTGQQHQDPAPDRLAVVGLAYQCRVDRTFPLVEEFDVTP